MLLIGLQMLCSCGVLIDGDFKSGETRQFSSTDASVMPLVKKFEQEAAKYKNRPDFKVGDIPVNFGDTRDKKFDGVCIKYPDGTREVILKQSWWEGSSEAMKEVIVFHELGHCRLGRSHNNETSLGFTSVMVKISVMNSVVPSSYFYEMFRDEYLKELFLNSDSEILNSLEATNSNGSDEEAGQSTTASL